jgi:ubiquinone/menaquinone biosynthesis C-methylase UbiE
MNNQPERIERGVPALAERHSFSLNQHIIQRAGIQRGMKVLDIGLGKGQLTRLIPRSAEVFGIDNSEHMIESLRSGLPWVRMSLGECLRIPFTAGFFDRILSSFTLKFVPKADRKDALREMDRCLTEGGRLVVGDFRYELDETLRLQQLLVDLNYRVNLIRTSRWSFIFIAEKSPADRRSHSLHMDIA